MLAGSFHIIKPSTPSALLRQSFGAVMLLIWLLFSAGQIQAQIQKGTSPAASLSFVSLKANTQHIQLKQNPALNLLSEAIDEELAEEELEEGEALASFLAIFYKSMLVNCSQSEQLLFSNLSQPRPLKQGIPLFVLYQSFKSFLV